MQASDAKDSKLAAGKKPHRWRRRAIVVLLVIVSLLAIGRAFMPKGIRWYVNRTIDRSLLYRGQIGDVTVHLWRGAYTIHDIRINKITGNVPVPLFTAKRMDLAIQWNALWNHKVVGRVLIDEPELNFVDAADESSSQTGTGGPWLQIIRDLFPFKINQTLIENGSIHFRAPDRDPPVDVYLTKLQASIENLSNIENETTPLAATVRAKGLAMDQAKFEFQMKLDPFAYYPTFEIATRLIGLDVTKLNAFSKAYGGFDFEQGFFHLVIELESREGQVRGYVKPLFRNIRIFDVIHDLKKDDPIEYFWEAIVGVTSELLKNRSRDQLATQIPLTGDLTGPQTDVLVVVGNVLRNAFIRAYLPRFQGAAKDINRLEFGKGSIVEPTSTGDSP